MSERMKALPFVVYEFFTKNCKWCSLEFLPISVLSFQFLAQGEGELEGDDQEIQKVRLSVSGIKRYFRTISVPKSFCSFSKESYSVLFLLALTKGRTCVVNSRQLWLLVLGDC